MVLLALMACDDLGQRRLLLRVIQGKPVEALSSASQQIHSKALLFKLVISQFAELRVSWARRTLDGNFLDLQMKATFRHSKVVDRDLNNEPYDLVSDIHHSPSCQLGYYSRCLAVGCKKTAGPSMVLHRISEAL